MMSSVHGQLLATAIDLEIGLHRLCVVYLLLQ